MQHYCQKQYSPFLKCSTKATTTYNEEHLCQFHYLSIKYSEDCAICLCSIKDKPARIILSCGHIFHQDCLGKCKDCICPMCRKQLSPQESKLVFGPTIVSSIAEDIYSLPYQRVNDTIDSVNCITHIADKSGWHSKHVKKVLIELKRAYDVSESLNDCMNGLESAQNLDETFQEANNKHSLLSDIIQNICEMINDIIVE
jgi:hypothetical protein